MERPTVPDGPEPNPQKTFYQRMSEIDAHRKNGENLVERVRRRTSDGTLVAHGPTLPHVSNEGEHSRGGD